ncbi:hypothetical protein SDC9_182917 [bioreactor metagenome]|uniref:Uncharacterized protein n=1 Tax=bioreactor metagenome TaxID=1076179 RepID=A0A645HBB6_9ZZZZ
MLRAVKLQRAFSAKKRNARAALIADCVRYKDGADLPREFAMRRTAGAHIRALDGYNADWRGKPFGMFAKRKAPDLLLTFIKRCAHG